MSSKKEYQENNEDLHKKVHLSIKVPRWMKNALQAVANKRGGNLSDVGKQGLSEFLDKNS